MSTQDERRAEAEQRLLEAAAELISEAGPAKVTLAGIGERAGYSRGLVTHHFGSKSALMRQLVDTVTQQFVDRIATVSETGTARQRLHALVDTYFDVLADLQPVNRARLVLWADAVAHDSPDVRPAMLEADRTFRRQVSTELAAAVDAGELPADVDATGLGSVVVAMLRGIALEHLVDPELDLGAAQREIEHLLDSRLG